MKPVTFNAANYGTMLTQKAESPMCASINHDMHFLYGYCVVYGVPI
jgi:hypothetical protein